MKKSWDRILGSNANRFQNLSEVLWNANRSLSVGIIFELDFKLAFDRSLDNCNKVRALSNYCGENCERIKNNTLLCLMWALFHTAMNFSDRELNKWHNSYLFIDLTEKREDFADTTDWSLPQRDLPLPIMQSRITGIFPHLWIGRQWAVQSVKFIRV